MELGGCRLLLTQRAECGNRESPLPAPKLPADPVPVEGLGKSSLAPGDGSGRAATCSAKRSLGHPEWAFFCSTRTWAPRTTGSQFNSFERGAELLMCSSIYGQQVHLLGPLPRQLHPEHITMIEAGSDQEVTRAPHATVPSQEGMQMAH